MESAKIRCKVGAFAIHTSVGGTKKVTYEWNEKNGFVAEIPTVMKYNDPLSGQERVDPRNLAQDILDRYDFLELVETVKVPEVVPTVKPRKSRKEQSHETLS